MSAADGVDPSQVVPSMLLRDVPAGIPASVTAVRGGTEMVRRFRSLGVRSGADITVLQRRGSGLVVISGNTRIALGPEMLDHVEVDVLTTESTR